VKIAVEKRLFWFLKEGIELDLSNNAHLDMYVQQTLSKGRVSDIRKLIHAIRPSDFAESFGRVKNFLPEEVRRFWEDWFGDTNKPTEKDTTPV
jgi:hypothetical protein